MKKLTYSSLVIGALASVVPAQAQVVISDFTSINTVTPFNLSGLAGDFTANADGSWIGNVGSTSYGQLVFNNGTQPDHDGGAMSSPFAAVNLTGYTGLALTARRGGSEAGASWLVWLMDAENDANVYAFPTASFSSGGTTVTLPLGVPNLTWNVDGAGDGVVNMAAITRLMVSGNSVLSGGNGTTAIHVGFDELSAVPEPEHYAMLMGLGLVGFAFYRRFSKAQAA